MNICMVLADKDFPPDIRVENEIECLTEAGHKVILVARGEPGKAPVSEWHKTLIYKVFPYSFLLRKLNALIFLVINYNYQWANFLRCIIHRHDIAAVHVHDLPMVKTALTAAKHERLPLVIDIHENYPVLLQITRPANQSLKQKIYYKIFYNLKRLRAYEQKMLLKSQQNIVVAKESEDRIAALGVPRDKITLVSNTVNVERFCSYPIFQTIIDDYRDFFTISYVGGFHPNRGIDTVIQALPIVIKQIPNVRLVLVGAKKVQALDTLIQELQLASYVIFTGWRDFAEVPSFLAASDLGVIIHKRNGHTETTLPHKLFQYMLAARPVIVSNCTPMRRVILDATCGVVVEPNDPQGLAEAIIKLHDDADLKEKLGRNGREAVLNRYNWRDEARKLIRMYEEI